MFFRERIVNSDKNNNDIIARLVNYIPLPCSMLNTNGIIYRMIVIVLSEKPMKNLYLKNKNNDTIIEL